MCHFRAKNGPFVKNKFFLVQTIITFVYLLGLFIVQNLKKILQQIQSYEDAPLLSPKWSICPKQIFFLKIIKIILIHLLATFIRQNLKKFFPWIESCEDAQFLGPKWPISPNDNFFSGSLLMSLVSFIHAYLHAKNQSKILIY